METPNNIEGQLTEQIMIIFSSFNENRIIEVDTSQYNKIYSHVYKTLRSIGLDEKMSEQYCAVNNHKKMIRKRYSKEIESLTDIFPNGCYTKTDDGEFVGISVMLKGVISGMLELNSDKDETTN